MLVLSVVLVFPRGAAAVTQVARNRHQIPVTGLLSVSALQQLRMAWRASPVTLNTQAGFAKGHFFQFGFTGLRRRWWGSVSHIC